MKVDDKQMAFNFSRFYGRVTRDLNVGGTTAAGRTGGVRPDASRNTGSLKSGQTLTGEVVSKNGNEVQIRVDKDTLIHARLDRDMNVSVGQSMTFEVQSGKSSSQTQIFLRPLYENMAQDANILKALDAASIPHNDRTAAMVAQMMKEGMSIDMQSLQNVYKDVAAFPDAELSDIMALHRLGLEVNEQNLNQIAGYRTLEHQILNGVADLAQEASEALLGLVDTAPEASGRLLHEMLQILGSGMTASGEGALQEELLALLEQTDGQSQLIGASEEGQVILQPGSGAAAEGSLQAQGAAADSLMEMMEQGEPVNAETAADKTVLKDMLSQSMPEEGVRASLAQKLLQMGASMETAAAIRSGDMSMQELADTVLKLLERGEFSKRALKELLSEPGLKDLLQNRMEHNWLLNTETEALDKETIFRLYTRLQDQTARLSQALSNVGAEQSAMGKSVAQMQESIDFLQQLNHTFTYVQLPLKLSSQETHGDLYVYTNKKNLARKDGTVSALLHLDMEHLGSLDVYVALTSGRVNTKFYLEREELLDFMEQHMYILNEHLARRGYDMEYEVLHHEQPVKVVDEMLKEDGNTSVLSQYSFDVRA